MEQARARRREREREREKERQRETVGIRGERARAGDGELGSRREQEGDIKGRSRGETERGERANMESEGLKSTC